MLQGIKSSALRVFTLTILCAASLQLQLVPISFFHFSEWNGRRNLVHVAPRGVELQGPRWPAVSLSERHRSFAGGNDDTDGGLSLPFSFRWIWSAGQVLTAKRGGGGGAECGDFTDTLMKRRMYWVQCEDHSTIPLISAWHFMFFSAVWVPVLFFILWLSDCSGKQLQSSETQGQIVGRTGNWGERRNDGGGVGGGEKGEGARPSSPSAPRFALGLRGWAVVWRRPVLQSPESDLLKVDYLTEFGEWLFVNEFPVADALDQVRHIKDVAPDQEGRMGNILAGSVTDFNLQARCASVVQRSSTIQFVHLLVKLTCIHLWKDTYYSEAKGCWT